MLSLLRVLTRALRARQVRGRDEPSRWVLSLLRVLTRALRARQCFVC